MAYIVENDIVVAALTKQLDTVSGEIVIKTRSHTQVAWFLFHLPTARVLAAQAASFIPSLPQVLFICTLSHTLWLFLKTSSWSHPCFSCNFNWNLTAVPQQPSEYTWNGPVTYLKPGMCSRALPPLKALNRWRGTAPYCCWQYTNFLWGSQIKLSSAMCLIVKVAYL